VATNGKTRTGKNKVEINDRRRQALELRRAGLGFAEIARQLGVSSPGTAFKIVKAALHATLQEPAEDVRKLELERLDRLQFAYWHSAIGSPARKGVGGKDIPAVAPDPESMDRVLKIMRQRAELLGLKQTEAIELGRIGIVDPEIAGRIMQAAMQGEGPGATG
jgi:hypothetical protein